MTKEKRIAQISKQIDKLAQEYYRLVNPSSDEFCETESCFFDDPRDEGECLIDSKSTLGQIYIADSALMLRESEDQ